jgi:hypothetical protein
MTFSRQTIGRNKEGIYGVCKIVHKLAHMLSALLLTTALFSVCGSAAPQHIRQTTFVLVHLPDYKLMPHQRLRFLAASTERQFRRHPTEFRLETDAHGRVSIPIDGRWDYFQLWLEIQISCPDYPYHDFTYGSSVLFDEGIVAANSCHGLLERLEPDSPYMPQ